MKAILTHLLARILLVVVALGVSACGNKGPLVPPKAATFNSVAPISK